MAGGDARLEVEPRRLIPARRTPEEDEALGEERWIPQRTILFVKQYQASVPRATRGGPSHVKAKESAKRFGGRRRPPVVVRQETRQAQRFVTECLVDPGLAVGRRVTLREQLVEDVENGAQA